MRILYIESDQLIKDLYCLKIEMNPAWKVVLLDNIVDTISYLKKGEELNVVICEQHLSDGDGNRIYEFIRKYHPTIPFILMGEKESDFNTNAFKNFNQDHPLNCLIIKSDEQNEDKLIECLHKIEASFLVDKVSSGTGISSGTETSEYVPVSVKYFLRTNSVPTEVFLKLNDDKFIKLINRHEMYESNLIKKYTDKGIKYLFIPKDQADNFSAHYTSLVKSTLVQKDISLGRKLELQQETILHSQMQARHMGVNEKTIETMTLVTESVTNTVFQNHDLFALVSGMIKKQDYLSEHSLSIAYIAGGIATEFGWDTQLTLSKLGLAAILHDVTLERENLAKINNLKSRDFIKLSEKDKATVSKHPFNAAQMLEQIPNALPDVSSIIFSHHEFPNGQGFPLGLDAANISQLSCVFIIAEDLVNEVYFNNRELSCDFFKEIESKFKLKYSIDNFRAPLDGFLCMLEKNEVLY